MPRKTFAFASLLVCFLFLPRAAFATITVTGTANAVIPSDQVVVTVALSTSHQTSLPAATAANEAILKNVQAALLKLGLPAVNFVTGPLTQNYTQTGPSDGFGTTAVPIWGWVAARSVIVTLPKGSAIGPAEVVAAWRAAGHAGAIGVAATISDTTAEMDALRKVALKDARRRADLIAGEVGQAIVAAIAVTETAATIDAAGKGVVTYSVQFSHK